MIQDIINNISPYYQKKKEPEAAHTIVYDSAVETLEPVYFFILDLMNDFGLAPEKLIDNFSSSPGSGHFAELGQRASVMQQQASKLMGDINTVLRSVLNIIYDLREFKIRLQSYEDLKSKDKNKAEAARLSLKQVWMDKVDIQKGNSSIKAMAFSQAGPFVTLIDAFLACSDEKDVKKLDINERVKRALLPRINEFNTWVENSERELQKRYEIEKTYLRSQVNSLKLYSRWVKPYLVNARELESKMDKDAALVKTFNTIILELSLLGKRKLNVKEAALEERLPRDFAKEKFLRTLKRNYYSCVLVEFKFRGIPQRVAQQSHFTFGGRAEITFKAYALNDEEIEKLKKEIEESDLGDVLRLIKGATEDSIEHLKEDIEEFLEEPSKEESKSKNNDSSNPFLALIGAYNEKPEKKEKPKSPEESKSPVKKDNWYESELIRPLAADEASETIFKLFDIYKKAHGMVVYT